MLAIIHPKTIQEPYVTRTANEHEPSYKDRGKRNRSRKLSIRKRIARHKYMIAQYNEIAKWNKNKTNKPRINHIIYDYDGNQLIPL